MQEFIINFINRFGYWGISLLIAIENLFPPIPSEIILTFSGFATTLADSNLKIIPVIIVSTVGSVTGAVILYLIGRLLNADRLKKILSGKTGKILRLKPEDVSRADGWFTRHGKKTIFFCRFIPIVRSLISIPAGISKMSFIIFLPLTVLGSLIWNSVLILLGKFAGDMWSQIAEYFDLYSTIALIVLLLAVLVIAAIFIKKRFLKPAPLSANGSSTTYPTDSSEKTIEIEANEKADSLADKETRTIVTVDDDDSDSATGN